jgi:ABC-type multidrug transport system fused ATPase/permease subunit
MNNLKFFIYTIFYPFIGLYILVGSLGLIVSGFTTYEQKSLMDLFTTNNSKLTILFILFLTCINSIRMTLHGILRHKIYMHTIKYFFENVCLEKLDYWDKNYDKSELVKCILTDINVYVNTISRIYSILIKTVLTIFIILYLLGSQSYIYVILGLILCFMRSIILEKIAKHWESKLDKVTEIRNELENEMTEYVNNNTQMQLYGLQNTYRNFMNLSLDKYNYNQFIESIWYGILMLSFGIVQRLIEFGVYIIAQYSITEISFYDTQLVLVYFKLLTESVQSLSDIPKEISRNKDNIYRLLRYINKQQIIESNIKIDECDEINIKFSNITFKYPTRESNYVFKNFDKTLNFKDKIILLGNSGKGKSTLIKLLLGLYVPNEGYVTINDKDVTLLNNIEIQKIISIVPQEPILLENRTIKENISLFIKNNKSDYEIKQALQLVKLDDLIDNLNEKIVTLSGGQKQRLAIVRTILNDTDIVILDEPFSALDKELKIEMQDLVFDFVKNKTLILITHDNSTIKYINEIYDCKIINLNK